MTTYQYKFKIHYETKIGETVRVVGSVPQLGRWWADSAPIMKWNKGHYWSLLACLPQQFEYKYVVTRKKGSGWEVIWEQGENRKIDWAWSKHRNVTHITIEDAWEQAGLSRVYHAKKKWWKESVVYQIYPRSFQDSNGDGVGDLKGIANRIDYLVDLGVDVIWICPFYESPNADNGYDVSDYRAISKEFGTMEDFEKLLKLCHEKGIRVVIDLVVNHTSDEHHWFKEARKSKDNPYRDYYVWKPPKGYGQEPNNWGSFFGDSCWKFDKETGEYYLHLFSEKQPDLNWENPKVRYEIYDMMKFWCEKGVDGFRMDVLNVISKDPNFPDAPQKNGKKYQWGGQYFVDGPRFHEFLQEMKAQVFSKYNDLLVVAETPFFTTDEAALLTNEDSGVVSMLFHFELMDLDSIPFDDLGKWAIQKWDIARLKEIQTKWQKDLEGKGWNSLYLENHDQGRSVSRFGNDKEYRVESAKMLATWLHMMQGTPYIYQGQELGMTNVNFNSINDFRDIETLQMYYRHVNELQQDPADVLKLIQVKGRDNGRTPMQWDSSLNAGFTKGVPWIKVNPNYEDINAEKEMRDENSVFSYYKQLIKVRKENPIIIHGSYELLETQREIYAFTRTLKRTNGEEILLVIANFSESNPVFYTPDSFSGKALVDFLLGNYPTDENEPLNGIKLRPFEARIYKLITTK